MRNNFNYEIILNRLKDAPKYNDDMRSSRFVVYSDCADMVQYSKVLQAFDKAFLIQKILQSMVLNNDHNTDMFKIIEQLTLKHFEDLQKSKASNL